MLFGLFGKDWIVIAVLLERRDIYRVNGNRGQGRSATKIRDGAKKHDRTIYYAVYDGEGKIIESGPGPAAASIPTDTMTRLTREFPTLKTVTDIVETLRGGFRAVAAKKLAWSGYPLD